MSTEEVSMVEMVSIYPNPSKDFIKIEIQNDYKNYYITLYDREGQSVINPQTLARNSEFKIDHLPRGLYFIHIVDAKTGQPSIEKFIKI